MRVSLATAKKLLVAAQGLDGGWKLPKGKEGVAQAVERLGYVQIDTIAVVRRAHHHTLWSRRGDYTPDMLDELVARDRRLLEGWTHAVSYIPACDWRYYDMSKGVYAQPEHIRQWLTDHRNLVDGVLARIREEGPLGSADFADTRPGRRGPWWDWKPAKQALEMLAAEGVLAVSHRRNFQRLYDLAERVLPPDLDTSPPTPEELGLFAARRALRSYGIVPRDRLGWASVKRTLAAAMDALVESGEATSLTVAGHDGRTWCALTDSLDSAARRRRRAKAVHILSPFDSCVARIRPTGLFDFDQKLEAYTPAAKRKWGYFCLPVLHGADFVARVDAKADRRARRLLLRKVLFEPGADADGLLAPLADKLREFAEFNGCDDIVVEATRPVKMKPALKRALGNT